MAAMDFELTITVPGPGLYRVDVPAPDDPLRTWHWIADSEEGAIADAQAALRRYFTQREINERAQSAPAQTHTITVDTGMLPPDAPENPETVDAGAS